MGYYRSDSGASFKPGAKVKPPVTNPTLQVRPEAGRAPNFTTGSASSQQSVVPPKKGMFGGRMAGVFKDPVNYVKGLFTLKNIGSTVLTGGAGYIGEELSRKLAQSAGTPGASKMSILGNLGMEAPVYQTPINNVTAEQVAEYKKSEEGRTFQDRLLGIYPNDKPDNTKTEKPKNPPKSVVENPNDDWADPIAGKGPKGNEVGSDAAPNTPGLQGPGDPAATASPGNPYEKGSQDYGMYIWAKKYGGMAQDVLDKTEKRGLKQSGYDAIREALGQTPKNPYAEGADFKIGDKDVSEIYKPTIDLKSDIAAYTDDFKVGYDVAPEGYTAGNSDLLYASASAFQQPNFDGSSQPIGGNTPEKPQPVQDFTNANTNPAEVGGYMGHPLLIKPSKETEASNREYGAMKFEFDPVKNMMVRVK